MKSKCSRWKDGIYDSELEIEIAATKSMNDGYHEMLHKIISSDKGSDNSCLLSNKPKN
jgi:hypothetical protein